MNWFSLAALATLEMSSSIYMAVEVKFIVLCYEKHTKNKHLQYVVNLFSFMWFQMKDNGNKHCLITV